MIRLPHRKLAVQIPSSFFRLRGGAFYEKVGIPVDVEIPAGGDALEVARERLGGILAGRGAR